MKSKKAKGIKDKKRRDKGAKGQREKGKRQKGEGRSKKLIVDGALDCGRSFL